ncbi:MAG: hypothetical protein A2Z86_06640 [Candidatus Glassbacteria bacterium GWA2_58_10]|uniref:Uncharacterized protein n=1 Tax=Candidatus Glassbacteria bacterium GWA2_58_10 TaxID=1817865 RepID=A0A1F5YFF9_9BACT|nr:MAG: hypothetical protein A2Z86_06640 [Candidatus Glassbacteria bacterium GWA2_58_10]
MDLTFSIKRSAKSRIIRANLSGLLIVLAVLPACSGKKAVLDPPAEISPLVLFPLVKGATWRYNYSFSINENRAGTRGDYFSIIQISGSLKFEVTEELNRTFQRSYTLDETIYTDSTNYELFAFGEFDTTYTIKQLSIEHASIDLFFDRDTVWYDYGEGGREFMMTREYSPGGSINLKLFNLPGMNFFDAPMGSATVTGTGEYLYYAVDEHLDRAVKIRRDVGVRSLSAMKGTGTRQSRLNWKDEALRYGLIQN